MVFETLRKAKNRIHLWIRPYGISLPLAIRPEVAALEQLITSYGKPIYNPNGKPSILFHSPRIWTTNTFFEQLMAISLSLRGARCFFSTCAANLPVCNASRIHLAHPFAMPCSHCITYQNDLLERTGFPNFPTSQFLTPELKKTARQTIDNLSDDDLDGFTYGDLPLGKMVLLSVKGFLLVEDLGYHPQSKQVYREFLYGAILVTSAITQLLAEQKPDIIFLVNGLFFEEQIMLALAKKNAIPVVNYEVGFLTNSFVFARGKIACHFDLSDHWDAQAKTSLTPSEETWLDEYLAGRRKDQHSLVKYWPTVEERIAVIKEQLHLQENQKVVMLFPNIVWDSAVLNRNTAFESLTDWVYEMIRFFEKQPDYQLVIRLHPAEVRLKNQETIERLQDRINTVFPSLPPNVSVIPSESDISSYRLIEMAYAVLVYTSTIGLEAALEGKPVLTAARTHYQYKGFTLDCETRAEYLSLLQKTLHPDSGSEYVTVNVPLARRYAYLFFKRHMVPFPAMQELAPDEIRPTIKYLDELKPGHFPEVDAICDFILASTSYTDAASLIH
jgi:hypothetical protein